MTNYITAIDFGSSKISVAVGENSDGAVRVLWCDSEPSAGIKYGEIINVVQCTKALRSLIGKASSALGTRITEAVVSISGRSLKSASRESVTPRENPRSPISASDIRKMTESEYFKHEEGSQILEVTPLHYCIGNYMNISSDEIEGISGSEVKTVYNVISGNPELVGARQQVLDGCGIRMLQGIISPVASAAAVLTEMERENGAVLIDMGKDLTEITIVKDNKVRLVKTIPFAGESVTRDIRNVANLTSKWAENVKVRHGICLEEQCPDNKILELINEDGEVDSDLELILLTRVIEARMSEIFDAVKYIVGQSGFEGKLRSGYVLTGGCAYTGYIKELASAILGCKVRLAAPRLACQEEAESIRDTFSSTLAGLLVEWFKPSLTTARRFTGTEPLFQQRGEPIRKDTVKQPQIELVSEPQSEPQDDEPVIGHNSDPQPEHKSERGGLFSFFTSKRKTATGTEPGPGPAPAGPSDATDQAYPSDPTSPTDQPETGRNTVEADPPKVNVKKKKGDGVFVGFVGELFGDNGMGNKL